MSIDAKNYYLDAMGIQRWSERGVVKSETFLLLEAETEKVRGILSLERLDKSLEAEKLLNAMLLAIGLKRVDLSASAENSVQSGLNIVMGEALARVVLQSDLSLEALREENVGRMQGNGAPVLVTYHPGCVLVDGGLKRRVWEDLKLVRSIK